MNIRAVLLSLAVLLLSVPAAASPRSTILFVFDEYPDLPGLTIINRSLRVT